MKTLLLTFALSVSLTSCEVGFVKKTKHEGGSLIQLTNFSSWLFNQNKIQSQDVLDSIIRLSEKSILDTTGHSKERKAILYINDVAGTTFKVFKPKNGDIRYIGYYENGVEKNGVEYLDHGQAACLFKLTNNGIRDGIYRCYHEDGSIRIIGWYRNGKDIHDSIRRFNPGEFRIE